MMLTEKQERFAQNIFAGMTQREAWGAAGYSTRYPLKIQDENACRLANQSKIEARVKELHTATASPLIMGVEERKQRLSEIARAKLTDYQELGADGSWINIGPESPNTAALQEITSHTEYNDKGSGAAVITKVKLHNPMAAIAELNKMEQVYNTGIEVKVDNRTIEVYVESEKARDMIKQLSRGYAPDGDQES